MNILEKLGLAVRDGVYETFLMYTDTTDLKELTSSGHKVDELMLSTDGLNRLYILHKGEDKAIQISCSVTFDYDTQEPTVKAHTPLETREILQRIASGNQK